MSKELNALECLEALEQDIKDRTILAEDRQLKLCEVIKQALLELQSINEAKPSEALMCLKEIGFAPLNECCGYPYTRISDEYDEDFNTIKQALQRLEKYEQLYGSKPSGEVISRAELCKAITKIFGSGEKFLDIIEEDLPYGYHYCKDDSAEIYIIDYTHNKYIHWYKLTHIGRDFHTDMKTKEEVIDFLQRLHDEWLKENGDE